MTREEVIKWIIYEKDSIDTEGYCATKENYARIQALDIAIEVLSVKDCHGCTHYDLLQTPVICHDCSRSYKDRYKDEKGTLDDMFTESAEAYNGWTGEEIGKTGDLVKKKDAIALHTVSADRLTGEWILVCDGGGECDNLYRCSHCGQEVGCEEYDKPKFCGECGADMRGKKNGDK